MIGRLARWWWCVGQVLLLLAARDAYAAEPGPLILVLRPPSAALDVDETLMRIQGELTADGFRVRPLVYEGAPAREPLLELARAHAQAAALVGLFPTPGQASAELWVVDRLAGRTATTRVEVNVPSESGSGVPPEVLARRAVELLRATLLEPWASTQKGKPAAPAPPPTKSAPPRSAQPSRLGGAVGLTVFGFEGADSWGAAPLLRVRGRVHRAVELRLSLSGLGARPTFVEREGTAEALQSLAQRELVGYLPLASAVRPYAAMGGGVSHVQVSAQARSPLVASERAQWSAAASGNVGLAVELSQRLSLGFEAQALLNMPRPVVRFAGRPVGTLGSPTLGVAFTLGGWL